MFRVAWPDVDNERVKLGRDGSRGFWPSCNEGPFVPVARRIPTPFQQEFPGRFGLDDHQLEELRNIACKGKDAETALQVVRDAAMDCLQAAKVQVSSDSNAKANSVQQLQPVLGISKGWGGRSPPQVGARAAAPGESDLVVAESPLHPMRQFARSDQVAAKPGNTQKHKPQNRN